MTAILAWLSGKAGALAIGAAIPVVFLFVKKMLPARLANAIAGLLHTQMGKLDSMDDPIRRGLYMALALDIVRIAEYELPDPGKGKERYALAAKKLCAVIPLLTGQEARIEQLIEASVVAMDAELKKAVPK